MTILLGFALFVHMSSRIPAPANKSAEDIVPLPEVSYGRVERLTNFLATSPQSRNIDVWLPDGYSQAKKYSVLYMHDGQMLFDAKTTWNHQEWEVDETVGRMIKVGAIQDCIVVGLWNRGTYRHADYFPEKPLSLLSAELRVQVVAKALSGKPLADQYLSFLVHDVKPYIDSHYSTKADRAHTFVAGSSMGGLISMYAMCEYPKIFGGAACLSTHWPGVVPAADDSTGKAFLSYLDANLPSPKGHRLYFDYGDHTLDALYRPFQEKADEIMRKHQWGEDSWVTLFFPGDDHSEKSWSKRLHLSLSFLLGKR